MNQSVNLVNFISVNNQTENSGSVACNTNSTKEFASFLDEANNSSMVEESMNNVSEQDISIKCETEQVLSDETINTEMKKNDVSDANEDCNIIDDFMMLEQEKANFVNNEDVLLDSGLCENEIASSVMFGDWMAYSDLSENIFTKFSDKQLNISTDKLEYADVMNAMKLFVDSNVIKNILSVSEVAQANESVEEVMFQEMDDASQSDIYTIFETISCLLQKVMEYFDLSTEDFSTKLESFDMELSDLFDSNGLKDFFLKMNNAETSDLVVDESLNTQLGMFLGGMDAEFENLVKYMSNLDDAITSEDISNCLNEFMELKNEIYQSDYSIKGDENEMPDEPEVIVYNNSTKYASDVIVSDNSTKDVSDDFDMQTDRNKSDDMYEQNITYRNQNADIGSVADKKFENPILQAIQDAMNTMEKVSDADKSVHQTDVVRQIVEQVRLHMNQQTTSMEIQLYPEHLGRIQIHVVSKEGVMTASIVAETETAKQAIESGLLNLKETIQQQDLKVEAIEVMVSTMGFESNDEQQSSYEEDHTPKSRRSIDLTDLTDDNPTTDEIELEKMKVSGSSVSFSA